MPQGQPPIESEARSGTCRIMFSAFWENGDKVNGEIKHLPPGTPTEMVKMLIASRDSKEKTDG